MSYTEGVDPLPIRGGGWVRGVARLDGVAKVQTNRPGNKKNGEGEKMSNLQL